MKRQINRISKEVTLIKKMLIYEGVIDKKTGTAWKNLLNASKQISKKWKGLSAAEEIRGQREKNVMTILTLAPRLVQSCRLNQMV